ncbi:ABC transporter permease [Neorhizobium alkalisoli]|uniref:Mannopine transport system permease protein n=1 Tax=Neorhizobium alkalisoli TaxID=528178 RepID=A0A561PZD9_9HYPH|nr:ABC transporter permease [Neorhizobium alkalisoli]TWF43429.1 mannopine transport system permease protein [Neorhizobium alkalisoli]
MTTTLFDRVREKLQLDATERDLSPGLSWLLLAPALLLLLCLFLAPVLGLAKLSLFDPQFSLRHYATLFGEDLYLKIIWRTVWTSALVTGLTLVLGYPIAMMMAKARGLWLAILSICVLLPLWISVLVRSYAWVVLLSRNGIVTTALREIGLIGPSTRLMFTDGAVILATTHVLLPLMILPLCASLNAIPKELASAAESLGAGRITAFRRITFPLSLPGAFSGAVLVFVMALGFYITPQLVGGPRSITAAMLIGQQVSYGGNWGLAAAMSVVLFLAALVVLLLGGRFLSENGEGGSR